MIGIFVVGDSARGMEPSSTESEKLPPLTNAGAAFGVVLGLAEAVVDNVGEEASEAGSKTRTVFMLVNELQPPFLNPPPPTPLALVPTAGSAVVGGVAAPPTGANPTDEKPPPPPPPPPTLAHPPTLATPSFLTAGAGAVIPPVGALTPAAPISLASSLASRLRSFSRSLSVSPEARARSSASFLRAMARAWWWWSYELRCW